MIKRRLNCRVCYSYTLDKVLDLGMTPLANSYLKERDLDKPETFFPLQVMNCAICGNIQLAHVVDPKVMFKKYLYASSTSPVFVKHFEDFAKEVGYKHFVIDIGGNDGILLKPFQKLGSKVLNIDPAKNIKSSVPTIHKFFTCNLAKQIVKKYGQADLVTATNVFAHVDDLEEIVTGVKILLCPKGQFVIEVADLDQMLDDGTFDLIYHEHLNYWSEKTLRYFFDLRGMVVTQIDKIPTHGGSLRAYARVI